CATHGESGRLVSPAEIPERSGGEDPSRFAKQLAGNHRSSPETRRLRFPPQGGTDRAHNAAPTRWDTQSRTRKLRRGGPHRPLPSRCTYFRCRIRLSGSTTLSSLFEAAA